MNYWLMKSEPNAFSIEDLEREGKTHWDGIRNYQARNFMMKEMKIGDLAFFYHSNCKEPGIVGLMEVCSEAYPDHTAWDENSKYFDPKSTEENPRWFMVDLKFVKKFDETITLGQIKADENLSEMLVIKRGMRLSIQPVSEKDFKYLCP